MGDARVSLVSHGGLSLAVENLAEDRVVAWHELHGVTSATLSRRDVPPGSVLLLGHEGERPYAAIIDAATGDWLLTARGDDITADEMITVTQKLNDVVGHVTVSRFTWGDEGFQEERRMTLPQRQRPETPEDTALAVCQALLLGRESEALDYVTPGMRARLEPGRLTLAIGAFASCSAAGMPGDEALIEVIQPVSERMAVSRLYAFRCVRTEAEHSAYQVDDVRCVES